MNNSNSNKPLKVLNIRERGEGKKAFWQEIGVAFTNRDGSINVVLNCLPLDGKLQIREQQREPGEEG